MALRSSPRRACPSFPSPVPTRSMTGAGSQRPGPGWPRPPRCFPPRRSHHRNHPAPRTRLHLPPRPMRRRPVAATSASSSRGPGGLGVLPGETEKKAWGERCCGVGSSVRVLHGGRTKISYATPVVTRPSGQCLPRVPLAHRAFPNKPRLLTANCPVSWKVDMSCRVPVLALGPALPIGRLICRVISLCFAGCLCFMRFTCLTRSMSFARPVRPPLGPFCGLWSVVCAAFPRLVPPSPSVCRFARACACPLGLSAAAGRCLTPRYVTLDARGRHVVTFE